MPTSPTLRDRIAAALHQDQTPPPATPWADEAPLDREYFLRRADVVLAVLPAPVDRRAVLREEADRIDATRADFPIAVQNGIMWATAELRRHAADETAATQAVDLPALAAALDGFGTLLATSSRDWGVYRIDAWLYAVILGWDCEQTEHDDTCVHGALEEMQQRHGWDAATVAKARRYRAAFRTLVETYQPAAGARQDGV